VWQGGTREDESVLWYCVEQELSELVKENNKDAIELFKQQKEVRSKCFGTKIFSAEYL
jgi:hypothetical protein